jgi:hypothetical protein
LPNSGVAQAICKKPQAAGSGQEAIAFAAYRFQLTAFCLASYCLLPAARCPLFSWHIFCSEVGVDKHHSRWKKMIASEITTSAPVHDGLLDARTNSLLHCDPSLMAELEHFSLITYAIPVERAHALVPHPFEVATVSIGRRIFALLSIESFRDAGQSFSADRSIAFEQTNYRLHVRLNEEDCGWLLGISLGSLSAIAPRRLWPLPWHLSAMELNTTYDQAAGRYHRYSLKTQSQWASARWELSDAGKPLPIKQDGSCHRLAVPIPNGTFADFFTRRDGELGVHRIRYSRLRPTRGHLRLASCDLLERLGLLTADELLRPFSVALQPSLACQVEAHSPTQTSPTFSGSVYDSHRDYLHSVSRHQHRAHHLGGADSVQEWPRLFGGCLPRQ